MAWIHYIKGHADSNSLPYEEPYLLNLLAQQPVQIPCMQSAVDAAIILNIWILHCAGPQGTITVSVNGQLQPLSGSFSVSAAQPATTAPELVSALPSGHSLQGSGGSLIKVGPRTCCTVIWRAIHASPSIFYMPIYPSWHRQGFHCHDVDVLGSLSLCGLGSEPEEPGMADLTKARFQGVMMLRHFVNMAQSVRSQGGRM
jgi:hypothetical protein